MLFHLKKTDMAIGHSQFILLYQFTVFSDITLFNSDFSFYIFKVIGKFSNKMPSCNNNTQIIADWN